MVLSVAHHRLFSHITFCCVIRIKESNILLLLVLLVLTCWLIDYCWATSHHSINCDSILVFVCTVHFFFGLIFVRNYGILFMINRFGAFLIFTFIWFQIFLLRRGFLITLFFSWLTILLFTKTNTVKICSVNCLQLKWNE